MLKHTRNTNNSGIRFISRFTMNNIAPKTQKCWTHKIVFKIKIATKFLEYSQSSTLSKEALARFYLSTTFASSSVASTLSPTSYAYLIAKIGNCNLNLRKL